MTETQIAPLQYPLKVKRSGAYITLLDATGREVIRKVVSHVSLEAYKQLDADLIALCRSDALVRELEELRQGWYEKWNSAPYGSKEAEAISFCNDGVLALISKHRKGT